ncbi:MAG: HAMP domain-containing histidine kinase [Chitinophagaceae bacterium]|nr:HAMP domain-containing histidine kinase [Anaerolineae bacterium]
MSPPNKVSFSQKEVPSGIDFATEVKSDRLAIMWKATLAGCVVMVFSYLSIFTFIDNLTANVWLFPAIILCIGCLITRELLERKQFNRAAWAYTLGALVAVSAALFDPHIMTAQLLPFVFVVVVFIVGLLLPPTNTFMVALISAVLSLVIPAVASNISPMSSQFFAIALMFLGALLAAQVTGELYAVTEWALLNYQRERRTNLDLFESRTELQRTLKRSEALSEKLKETNVELEHAHAAAEAAKNFRGQFLANMSHELRTPLNAIIGFSETMLKFPMMYDNVPLPTTYQADLNQIYTSGRQLLDLINDILDLSRVDAGKLEIYMQRVNPEPVIETVLAIAGGLLGNKPVKLLCELPKPIPTVWADETRLRQVLVNLYSNACKFTESGAITLVMRESPEGVIFSVRDTGSGIRIDQIGMIFEEFRQATAAGRDPRSGSGLGLAISRQLLTLMGGRIWAESELGRGSTFHFVVPPYHKEKLQTIEAPAVLIEPDKTPLPAPPTDLPAEIMPSHVTPVSPTKAVL